MVESDDRALVACPAIPAERDPRLDRNPGSDCTRQDGLAVRGILEFEALPAGERDDAGRDAVGPECLRCTERELELGARPDQDDLGDAAVVGIAQDVAAAAQAVARLLGRARERRQLLAGQRQCDRTGRIRGASLGCHRPRGGRLVAIARPDEPQVRDRPQGCIVLDRLVGRAILAESDRIVGPDIDHVESAEGGEPDRAAHVVAEGEECRRVGHEAIVIRDPVDDPAHRMLAYPEAQIPAR